MRVVAISDTHTLHHRITLPPGDILIHSGDFCSYGTQREVRRFSTWFQNQDFKHKIVIAGNHEVCLENFSRNTIQQEIFPNVHYLEGTHVEIEGLIFWGGPWTPRFCDWAYNVDRDKIKLYWDNIHPDTNVLITHGPPYRILDKTLSGEYVGCEYLNDKINILDKLKLHIFGHIHHSYGIMDYGHVKFINASICNEDYRPINPPIVVEI